jgi:uncharacterized protein (UPF0248 family)
MVTIRKLLSRIQHDPEFGTAEFSLGCFDRVTGRIEWIPLVEVHLASGNWFSFEADDEQGTRRAIPFHRVRRVLRNGQCIWARPERPGQPAPGDDCG